jgi:hypothetical protein
MISEQGKEFAVRNSQLSLITTYFWVISIGSR